jgi:hypothetical protein
MHRAARQAVRDLDSELAKSGELIVLARLGDAPDGRHTTFLCEHVPAKVTLVQPQDLTVTSLPAGTVIISPSRLAARKWPAPPRVDDRVFIADGGRLLVCAIQSVVERRVAGFVVRYELSVRS